MAAARSAQAASVKRLVGPRRGFCSRSPASPRDQGANLAGFAQPQQPHPRFGRLAAQRPLLPLQLLARLADQFHVADPRHDALLSRPDRLPSFFSVRIGRNAYKTHLQHVATATAMTFERLIDRLNDEPRAKTRRSHFATLWTAA
jgi:hypothetical protein